MRILHLAYEDPWRPGSGGGAVRTLEVDRRLARRHEVTACVAAYPGARERTVDDVHWVPIGPARRGRLPQLAWFALAGFAARRPADIVVEVSRYSASMASPAASPMRRAAASGLNLYG